MGSTHRNTRALLQRF